MNKSDLISALAGATGTTKTAAGETLEALTGIIAKSLKKGDDVVISGFGTFALKKRAARTGRNPQTGETLKIKASRSAAFRAAKGLKDAIA